MTEFNFQAFLDSTIANVEKLEGEGFYMDHIIAGHGGSVGDYRYTIDTLPTIGSSVTGFHKTDEGSKPYIFRVVGICFYDGATPKNSKSVGAILIDPVTENLA